MSEVPAKITKYQVPDILELYSEDGLTARETANKLNVLLNQSPKPEWIKKHPFVKDSAGNALPYLPIERVEWLLTRIFISWRVEIKAIQLVANSVVALVRLHYWNVDTNEWSWQDGVGAAPLQTDKDAGAIEFNKIKSGAVMMAAPSAESYAVKDAADKIGRIFGKDVSRKEQISYESNLAKFDSPERDLKTATKKIIDGLDSYAGDDRDTLKEMCVAKQKSGELTMAILQNVAEKIGLEL